MTSIPAPTRIVHLEPMNKRSNDMRKKIAQGGYELMNLIAFVTFMALMFALCSMIRFA